MPRTCLACSSPERLSIEKALIAGESLRNIAKHVSISPAGLLRHKNHVANAIGRAQSQHEECLGETLLDEMRRVQRGTCSPGRNPMATTEAQLSRCAKCASAWNRSARCLRRRARLAPGRLKTSTMTGASSVMRNSGRSRLSSQKPQSVRPGNLNF
jgi:hypothetical protein